MHFIYSKPQQIWLVALNLKYTKIGNGRTANEYKNPYFPKRETSSFPTERYCCRLTIFQCRNNEIPDKICKSFVLLFDNFSNNTLFSSISQLFPHHSHADVVKTIDRITIKLSQHSTQFNEQLNPNPKQFNKITSNYNQH